MSGFADLFSDASAAQLVRGLGDPLRITLANSSTHLLKGVPVGDDAWREAGEPQSFAVFQIGIEIVSADLPQGTIRAHLVPAGLVERLDRPLSSALHISDVRETGQGIWLLVCEP